VQRVEAAVTAILEQRAHDALASRVSPTSLARLRRTVAPALLANQVALARNLTRVPLVAYSLEAVSPPTLDGVKQGRVNQTVTLRYRLVGDPVISEDTVATTFERWRGRWVLTRWHPQRREVWDVGPVRSVLRGPVLVLGNVAAERLAAVASASQRALAAVRSTWPYSWSRRVTVVVPADAQDTAVLLDLPQFEIDGLGALTNTVGPDYRGRAALRVTVNPMHFWQTSPLGQQILLRHEFTHVAQRGLGPQRNGQVPEWMKEGVATYVGYLHSGVPFSVAASDLLARMRTGRLPAFPADIDFAFARSPHQRWLAYEAGWTFCVYLADMYGPQAPFRFYRALAMADGSTAQRVVSSLRAVLGQSQPDVVRGWHTWLLTRA